MPNAYTFDAGDGNVKTFKNRKAMYDYMISVGEVILEGDDAVVFASAVASSQDPKSVVAASRIKLESSDVDAVAALGGK